GLLDHQPAREALAGRLAVVALGGEALPPTGREDALTDIRALLAAQDNPAVSIVVLPGALAATTSLVVAQADLVVFVTDSVESARLAQRAPYASHPAVHLVYATR